MREEAAMKINYAIAVSVIGSFLLGAGAVQMLHAQAKPPAYALAEITVKNEDGYKKEFLPEAQRIIKEGGGIYLAGGFNKTTALSGTPPANRVVLIRYENMDTLKKWWDGGGRDIQEKVGSKYADFRVFAIEGIEAK
jgi:uncharacterized protein (DUF1330 family)